MIRVLIACEFSGVVRDCFRALGFDAWSCDLLESERPGPHLVGDVRNYLGMGWQLMIAHPPCTHLTTSGARWFANKRPEQAEAVRFVYDLWRAPIRHIAIENPMGVLSRHIGKPAQTIQPWQFGHGETKATCLWLKRLPPLVPTDIVEGREPRVHQHFRSWRARSRTLPGIAAAMAEQWGSALKLESLPLFGRAA